MDSLGGLPVNVEHVPHAVHTRTRSGTSTSCKSRPLALRDEKTTGAVTRDTAPQQMNAGAI
jgi:hypothetical protein